MLDQPSIPLRVECPPGACVCRRELLLDDPRADRRILMLTREEEKKLLAKMEAVATYAELRKLEARMAELLGIVLQIKPSPRGVKTVFGFQITLADQAGLCRKTIKALPAAVRKCLRNHPEIAWAILDEHDLLDAQRPADLAELDIDFDAGEAAPSLAASAS
jgi:hypothetical protein